jgi:hypothetical protein
MAIASILYIPIAPWAFYRVVCDTLKAPRPDPEIPTLPLFEI